MKHISKISLTLLALTMAMTVSATQYCETKVTSTNGAQTASYTCSSLGNNQYQIIFESTNAFDSFKESNFWVTISGTNTSVPGNFVQSGNKLSYVFTSTTTPDIYVATFYVVYSGVEHTFNLPTDEDFTQVCGDSGDSGGSGDSGDEEIVKSNYCSKELTGNRHSKKISLTCTKESEGNYQIIIEGEYLKGVAGTNVLVNDNNATCYLRDCDEITSTKITCTISSTKDPTFNTPLYITFTDGTSEEEYTKPSDIIWGVCGVELEPIYTEFSESICYGETYTWNEQTYSEGGDYEQTFEAVNGADSIVTLHLTVHEQTSATTEEVTIDYGETYTWNGNTYSASGEYTITLQDANGCDYQATLNLTVNSNSPSTPSTCTYTGGPGDALMEQPGQDQFESGYRITLTLDEADTDKIHITATVFDDDAPASTAWFQNYPNYNYAENTAQHKFANTNQNTFETTISISSLISNREDGIIRFAIKFEYSDGGIKVTTPEYFYLDGSGCAQRVFAIYHHDDLPATPLEGEDQFTEFAGGNILQSIQYKRRMPSEVWETLSVPFEVDSVTAFDPATGKHVRLYAQYNNGSTQAGHYWLRYFKTKKVTASNFQPNWYDIEATSEEAAKPKKDTAYIIRLPYGNGYYEGKYIVFHGRGYQTIAKTYNAPALPQDDYYSYSGNNTMMPQYLSSAYVLDNAGYYFTSSSTVTLPPFECSVNATAATTAKMPRIALNGKNNTTTDLTLLPTTDLQGGVIYSIFGAAVARFNTIDEYDQACQTLAAGVYVIVTPSTTTKIQIP